MRHFRYRRVSWQERKIREGWRSDPFTLTAIAIAMGTVGVGASVYAMTNQPKAPKAPDAVAAPSEADAAKTAEDTLTSQRRALIASGGETMFTGAGGAPLLAGQTSSKTLLGV